MISLKKRNITVLSEDELAIVSGGRDDDSDDDDDETVGCPNDSFTPDCFMPDTDGCPPDYSDECPPDTDTNKCDE